MIVPRWCCGILAASLVALLTPGCGLPPCVEGAIRIEVLELQPGSTCLWELWPVDAAIVARADQNAGPSASCDTQWLENLNPPNDESLGAVGVSRVGIKMAILPGIDYTFDDCNLITEGIVLSINQRYDDFDAALAGQHEGDSDAFFVEVSYRTLDECSMYPFEQAMPTHAKVCSNTYRARVTQL